MIHSSTPTPKRAGAVSIGLMIALAVLGGLLSHNHGSTGKMFPRLHNARQSRIQTRQAARAPVPAPATALPAPKK